MGSINDKEKEFIKAVENLEFKIDTNKIWENVSPRLSNKRKTRVTGFYLLGLLVAVVLGVSSTYLYMNSESNSLSASNDIAATSKNLTKAKQTHPINVKSKLSNIENDIYTKQNEIKENKTSFKNIARNENNHTNLNALTTKGTNNKSLKETENLIKQKNIESDDLPKNIKPVSYINSDDLKAKTNLNKSTNLFDDSQNVSDKIILNKVDVNNSRIEQEELFGLASIFPLPIKSDASFVKIGDQILTANVLEGNKSKWARFYTIRVGSNQSFMQNNLVPGSEFNGSQFDKEKGVIGFSSDVLFGMEHRNGWRLLGGISVYNHVASFSDSSITSETSTIPGTNQHINTFGETVDVNTELSRVVETYNDILWHRKHLFVDVSLGVGKVLKSFGPLSISSDVFVKYNLYSQHSGYYFEESLGTITKFKSGEDNIYNSSNGLSTSVAINLEWNLGKTSLGLSPYYGYRFNSIVNSNNFYKTKDNSVGLQLSFTYRPF